MRQGFRIALITATAAAGWMALSGAALAGDVTCAWRSAPEMTKTALVQEFSSHGGRPIEELGLDNDAVGALSKKCYDGKDPAQVKKAMMGMAMEVAAGDSLLNKYGILRSSLDRAWKRLEPSQRDGLQAFASSVYERTKIDPRAKLALFNVAAELGAPMDTEFLQSDQFVEIQAYYMGRSLREAAEGQF